LIFDITESFANLRPWLDGYAHVVKRRLAGHEHKLQQNGAPIRKQHVFPDGSNISALSLWQNIHRHRGQIQGNWQNLQMRQLGQGPAQIGHSQKLTTIGETLSGIPSEKHLKVHCLGPSCRRQSFQDPAIRVYKNWDWSEFAKV